MSISRKRIAEYFPNLTTEQVNTIRSAMIGNHPCAWTPRKAMEVIDEALGTHGVEYIPRGHNIKSPAITYCNTGDSYGTTILLVNGNFRIGSWADIVERGNYD